MVGLVELNFEIALIAMLPRNDRVKNNVYARETALLSNAGERGNLNDLIVKSTDFATLGLNQTGFYD